jgi:hypothetical protein
LALHTNKINIERIRKELAMAQDLIKIMEDFSVKAQSKMNQKLRKEEAIRLDAFFRTGGKLE